MNINKVAIIVNENERVINDLARNMHVWVAGTDKNKAVVESLWKQKLPEELTVSHFDIPSDASAEDICIIAIDLVENHHSSVFSANPWLEIQVYGCTLTERLINEFREFKGVKTEKQEYGFKVTRPRE